MQIKTKAFRRLFYYLTISICITAVIGKNAYADKQADIATAKEEFKKGDLEYKLGNFTKSLEHYKKALRLAPRPSIIFNIAQCYRAMENYKKALFYYELYISESGRKNFGQPVPFEQEVKKNIQQLRDKITELKKANVEMERAKNEEKSRRIELERERDIEKTKKAEQKTEPTPVKKEHTPAVQDLHESHRTKTIWAYTTLGIGAASMVVGGILYGVGISGASSAHEEYKAARGQDNISAAWADVESNNKLIYAGHALTAVGAIALGISIYQFVTRPDLPPEKTANSRKNWKVTVGGSGIWLKGTF